MRHDSIMLIPAIPWPPLRMMCMFMPKDNTVILEDGEMNEIDRELEFKRFCLMIKPLKNRPTVAVQVNLKDPACF